MQQDLQIIAQATKEVVDFVKKVGGPSLEEWGKTLGDLAREKRLKTQMAIWNRAQEMCQKSGVSPKAVDIKILLPLLGNGSLENDPTLQEMWAGLLASYAKGGIVTPSYPHILKELSATEVIVLKSLHEARKNANLKGRDLLTHGSAKENICKVLSLSNEQYNLIIDNLFRLYLIQPVGASGVLLGRKHPVAVKSNEIVHITSLGEGLVEACTQFSEKTTNGNSEKMKLIKGPEQDNVARLG